MEGTNITFQCDEGYSPVGEMTTTCTAHGQWEPNPEDTQCMMMDSKGNKHQFENSNDIAARLISPSQLMATLHVRTKHFRCMYHHVCL